MAYRNWETARLTGGRFLVIIDETCHTATGVERQGFSAEEARARWVEDMTWLGLAPDAHYSTAEIAPKRDAVLREWGLRLPVAIGKGTGAGHWIELPWPSPGRGAVYSEALVVGCVVDDNTLGIGGFWRGEDLKMQYLLYAHWERVLGYPQVAQGYLPTVARTPNGGKVSQSVGEVSVRQLREAGYEPWQIIGTLLECARVSELAGYASTMIPADCLTAQEVKWLEWRGEVDYHEDLLTDAAGKPWEATVRAWVDNERAGLRPKTDAPRRAG